jgi:hypothetical protein
MSDILTELLGGTISKDQNVKLSDKEKCSKSLELFAITYFPDIFFMPFNDIHREIFASLEDILFNKQDRHNYFARAIPRRSGKSQIVSFLLPLFCICYKLHLNILIVSETQDQARNFVRYPWRT